MIPRPHVPDEFDAFWQAVVAEAMAAPLYYMRDARPQRTVTGHLVETFDFKGVKGELLHGWIAYPEGARRSPGFVWLPPYGRESVLPDVYGTREGMVSLSFNFHGLGAFHQEKYVPSRGYFAEGVADPETWIFRELIQNAIISCRVLEAQVEVNEERIGAAGMSQGGGMAIWLGAWCPIVKAVCADMPFLGATWVSLVRGAYRYPLKELNDYADTIPIGLQRVLNTVSYFDTAHQASRCVKPTWMSLGEKDPAVRPEYAEVIFDALAGEKQLVRYEGGHDWDEGMVGNNLAWFRQWL